MKNRNTISVVFTIMLVCIISLSAYAQEENQAGEQSLSEMSLEDLLNMEVTTASKKAEKTTDAPGVISTITAEEIRSFGANSLMDVLARAASIQPLSVSVFPDNITAVRGDLRSNQDNHVLLLLNGRPVRDGSNGGTNEGFYTGFPVAAIDRIEIIRGPGSVLYGSNAFAGVINIITKASSESSLKVSALTGSFGTVGANVTGSVSHEDFNALVGFKFDNSEGWDFQALTKRPGAEDRYVDFKYGQKNLGVTADVNYKSLRFLAFYSGIEHDMLGIIPYQTFSGINQFTKIFLNLGYNYKFSENWEATLNITHNYNRLKIGEGAIANPDRHKSQDYLGELTINGSISENINLVFGGVLESRNKNEDEQFSVIAPYHQQNLSAYFQADFRPVESLKLIAGAQLNKPDGGDADVVPRAGVIYNISNELGVKVLYAQAFRSPFPLEQYIKNPTLLGNPDLESEKIGTLDAQLFYSAKSLELTATYFSSNYSNSITRIPTATAGVVTFTNQGDLSVSGFEVEGKGTLSSNVFVLGSVTYQKNKEELLVTPQTMAKIGVMYNPGSGLNIGLFNTYFGAPKENTAPKVNPAADAVSLLSLNITYKLPVSLPVELSIYAQNLLDADYNYTEFNRNWINTFPLSGGRAIFGKISLTL